MVVTRTDPAAAASIVEGAIVRVRVWGTDNARKLEGPRPYVIGSDPKCWWPLLDPKGHISAHHARLDFDGTRWVLADLGSKNGLHVGRVKHKQIVVEPGLAIRIGSLTVVAESHQTIEQRMFLRRILGFADDKLNTVEIALQLLRATLKERKPLMLCGRGDLVQIARSLHRRMLGNARPFVLCDPRRETGEESVRSAQNYERGMQALRAASTGSLCVVSERLPPDIDEVHAALRDPAMQVQLIVCAEKTKKGDELAAEPIIVPPLASRRGEIDHIIREYAEDAMAELDAAGSFLPVDRPWIAENSASSLPEIEKGTLRLVALRKYGSLNRAAAALGMTHVALMKWLRKRRPVPMAIEP